MQLRSVNYYAALPASPKERISTYRGKQDWYLRAWALLDPLFQALHQRDSNLNMLERATTPLVVVCLQLPTGGLHHRQEAQAMPRVGYRLQSSSGVANGTSEYPPQCNIRAQLAQPVIWTEEDASRVLLGGEIWPAAWATAVHLERLMQSSLVHELSAEDTLHIVELGSGVGLCGLVASAHSPINTHLFLTDETPELCEVNANALSQLRPDIKAEALTLEWGQPLHPTVSATSSGSRRILVIGCEVTPMPSTHDQLLDTVAALLSAPVVATGLGVFTVDACKVENGGLYPRDCPNNALGRALCAGHKFLYNVQRRGLRWRAAEVWHAEDIRRVCEDRRVGVSVERIREFACTSEFVVMVHVWHAGRGWDPDSE